MARADAIGLFWADVKKEKAAKKEKVKRLPPEKFWLDPTYLPGFAEALEFQPDLYTDGELITAAYAHEPMSFDIEVYPNYCLFAFKGCISKKIVYFECYDHVLTPMDRAKMKWILDSFCIINFNGRKYDFPVTTLALAGKDCEKMWDATQMLIEFGLQAQEVYKKYGTKSMQINQIDLIELTALGPGLKVCAGRLHAPRMQDLPFAPGTFLTMNQIRVLRRYCINDLDNTILLYENVKPLIEIRASQGEKYGLDLRSHSDAQMAEAIIGSEIRKRTGRKHIPRTELPPGTVYHYQIPPHIKYSTPLLNWVLETIRHATFRISETDGSVVMPPELAQMTITMGQSTYKMGIGGLHSQEKSAAHVSDEDHVVIDTDVTSYYPYLIMNAGLVPENLGPIFMLVYSQIVAERVAAKARKDTKTAEVLKIVVNGTFGKLGSKWSIMYAPNLMLQVTLTGQLNILMLAERLELAGIQVTSVNTDGIVVKCKRSMEDTFHGIVKQWEKETGLGTEETRYRATYSKDINNYIAVYEQPDKGKLFKTKGLYAETAPKKNAVNEICVDAVKAFIGEGVSPEVTVNGCRDIRKFTTMRAVRGGAVKLDKGSYDVNASVEKMRDIVRSVGGYDVGDELWALPGMPVEDAKPLSDIYKMVCANNKGVYLGKIIRWYYGTGAEGEIIAATSGNKVARTDGATPCMDLPDEFPADINLQWYVDETYRILRDIGFLKDEETESEEESEEEPV